MHNPILSQIRTNHSGVIAIEILDFCIQPNGWCSASVHQMGYPFIFNGGLQIFKHLQLLTINCKSFNILEVSFPNLELSAYKTLLPQQVIKISHAHDENAL